MSAQVTEQQVPRRIVEPSVWMPNYRQDLVPEDNRGKKNLSSGHGSQLRVLITVFPKTRLMPSRKEKREYWQLQMLLARENLKNAETPLERQQLENRIAKCERETQLLEYM